MDASYVPPSVQWSKIPNFGYTVRYENFEPLGIALKPAHQDSVIGAGKYNIDVQHFADVAQESSHEGRATDI